MTLRGYISRTIPFTNDDTASLIEYPQSTEIRTLYPHIIRVGTTKRGAIVISGYACSVACAGINGRN
jgi:hypothetical protein